jgi:hypothetical protein
VQEREVNADLESALGSGVRGHGGVVRGGDRAHDREPEAMVTILFARPLGGQALEWLEQPLHLLCKDLSAGVGD